MMPDEFDEITTPNWREEVSEFHMNKMSLLTSLLSSASPDDIDTWCTFFHGYDIQDSNSTYRTVVSNLGGYRFARRGSEFRIRERLR